MFNKIKNWFEELRDPELAEARRIAGERVAEIQQKLANGATMEEVSTRLVLENTLEWDRERQTWTVTTFQLAPNQEIVLWAGRGGQHMEHAHVSGVLADGFDPDGVNTYTIVFER